MELNVKILHCTVVEKKKLHTHIHTYKVHFTRTGELSGYTLIFTRARARKQMDAFSFPAQTCPAPQSPKYVHADTPAAMPNFIDSFPSHSHSSGF